MVGSGSGSMVSVDDGVVVGTVEDGVGDGLVVGDGDVVVEGRVVVGAGALPPPPSARTARP